MYLTKIPKLDMYLLQLHVLNMQQKKKKNLLHTTWKKSKIDENISFTKAKK